MQIKLEKNIPLLSIVTGDKESVATLHKGDSVRFLGVVEGTYSYPYGLLVETSAGERGLLAAAELGYPMYYKINKDSAVAVKVKSMGLEKKGKSRIGHWFYNVVTDNGKKEKVDLDDVRPILPDSIGKVQLRKDGDYFMTKKKFERLYIGKKLAENDALYRPAWLIDKTKKGFLAYYPNIEIIDVNDGTIRNPLVIYDKDSVAVQFAYEDGHVRTNNRWIVKWTPLLGTIVDCDFFCGLIEGSLYTGWFDEGEEDYSRPNVGSWKEVPWWKWAVAILWIICGLIWVFLMCTLPSLIFEALLYCRYVYYHLSDGAVASIFGVIALVATYIWFVLMTVWGCLWLFLPIIVFAGIGAWGYAERLLGTTPHERCTQCRRMEINLYRNTEFIREYDEWRHDSQAIASHTDRWKTWTDVTTKWSDGTTSHSRENERNHSRTTTLYADYNVLYHVKLYHKYYECQACGNVEAIPEEKLTELMRHKTGEHTTVTET